jgi:hypothetical protein
VGTNRDIVAETPSDWNLGPRAREWQTARIKLRFPEASFVPTKVKLLLTLAVIAIGAFCAWLEMTYADAFVAKVIVGLVVFLVIALWMFPEAGVKDGQQKPD